MLKELCRSVNVQEKLRAQRLHLEFIARPDYQFVQYVSGISSCDIDVALFFRVVQAGKQTNLLVISVVQEPLDHTMQEPHHLRLPLI